MLSLPRDHIKVIDDCCHRIRDIVDLRERLASTIVGNMRLQQLLQKFRDRRASDPRDKVYALLGIVRGSPTNLKHGSSRTMTNFKRMVPDYSLTETEAFQQATLECIYEECSLSVLSTELGRKFRNDLPSWVPDWGAPGGFTYDIRVAAAALYNARPSRDITQEVRVQENVLDLNGYCFDAIEYVGEIMLGGDVPSICQATLLKWLKKVIDKPTLSVRQSDLNHDLWRVLCADVITRGRISALGLQRTTPYDELKFMTWALRSDKSPFRVENMMRRVIKETCIWSVEAVAWHDVLMLWDGRPVLKDAYHVPLIGTTKLIPAMTCTEDVAPVRIIEAFERLLDFVKVEDEDRGTMMAAFHQRRTSLDDALWADLLHKIRKKMLSSLGVGRSLGLSPRILEGFVSAADTAIMAATLSRRLIIGHDYIGLGPANAKVGDGLYLLNGGKTPFVLRERSARDFFEVVGDSYIKDMMDGQGTPAYTVPILLV
jgi:hypothetical protein